MRKVFYSLVSTFLIIFLNSCAYPGLILGIGGTTYGVYKEANTHYPDKIPDLPDIPNISNFLQSPFSKNTSKATDDVNNEFGFECTKEVNNKEQSDCFNKFKKSLASKGDKSSLHQKPMTKEEEATFFDDVTSNSYVEKSNKVKNQLSPWVAPKKSRTLKSKIQPRKTDLAFKSSSHSPEILNLYLLNWVKSWQRKDIKSYISFYSKNFTGSKRSHYQWKTHRHQAIKNNSNISIEVSNVHIYQRKDEVEVNFTQHFKSDNFSDIGIKELIWTKNSDGWKIVKETWMPKSDSTLRKEANLSNNFVSSHLLSWINAWGNQNFNSYKSFYAKDFTGINHSRKDWETQRSLALKLNSNISIQISNIQLSQNNKIIEVNFIQRFKSDHFHDIGIKELIWRKTGSHWKILKETWMPI